MYKGFWNMRLKVIVVVGLLIAVIMGCTSKKKFTKEIIVSSDPPEAQVLLDGTQVGVTPAKFPVDFIINLDYPDRGMRRHEIMVKKNGFEPATKYIHDNDPPRVHFILVPTEKKDKPPPPPPPPPKDPRMP